MFGRQLELFKLLGFSVKVDLSWLIIAVLIVWSLAVGLFPLYAPGLGPMSYWWMGLVGAIGLFGSIVLHELSHSLVARRFGVEMRGITLFIFGGVAEMDDEPPSAAAEFFVAIVGPVSSLVIAMACWLLEEAAMLVHSPVQVVAVLAYLAAINVILAVFNLIPAFPLDGGRVLRSILWHVGGNLRWATRVTSTLGQGFGILLIILGAVTFVAGNFIGGMWWFLLGLFVRQAAQASYQQLLMRRVLQDVPVARFMEPNVQTVSPSLSVDRLVDDYIYRYHFKMFPVVDEDRIIGCVSTQQIRELPREEWPQHAVRDVVQPCSDLNSIDIHSDAMTALKKMNRTGTSRLMVVENGQLRGIVSIKDLMRLISLKMELEEGV